MSRELMIRSLDDGTFKGKRVLVRLDINSPVDKATKRIANDNRIRKSISTVRDLMEKGARVVLVSHQGDTTDYGGLISLREHAERLSALLGRKIDFIEDVAGPAAVERVMALKDGEALLLENLRYLTEEVSTFEDVVKLTPEQMKCVYLVRRLGPLFDCYVNDAFSAAHRNAPSMVAFQEFLPAYGGRLLIEELRALSAITDHPEEPCIYLLGGSRAGDAFGMIRKVLSDKSADAILCTGLVGHIFMMADGLHLGAASEQLIKEKGYEKYIVQARGYLAEFRDKIHYPLDVAFSRAGTREECTTRALPTEALIFDIGTETIAAYVRIIAKAKTIFVNGPAGIYEEELSSTGTEALWKAVEGASGFSVVGGGDTVTSFTRFTDLSRIDYVSTAGGALIRYLSGVDLPLITAMKKAYERS